MKIAVFGYYQHLNYGDDRIGQAIIQALQGHNVVLLPHNLEPPSMNWFDFIIIGGGGLVWERVGIWQHIKTWLKNSNKPFAVLGLGINELNNEMKPDLIWMANNALMFAVRDRKSHQLLDRHPKVKVLSDLTWMIPFPFRANNPNGETFAVSLASKHPQGYDPNIWGEIILKVGNTIPFPLRFGEKHESDIFRAIGYKNIENEFSIVSLYECRYLVGTRYHSIVFALQVGIPFIAILYDDKVKRLLDDNHLSDLGINSFEYDQMPLKLIYLKNNYEDISSRIKLISNRLRLEGVQLRDSLVKITEEVNQSILKQRSSYFKQRVKLVLNYLAK